MTRRLRFRAGLKRLTQVLTGVALAFCLITASVMPPALGRPNFGIPEGVPVPPASVSNSVLTTAAQDLGLPRTDLRLLRVNEETWTDGCLGIGLPHEGCLQALVDGWQVEVVYNNQSWFYRTDATGDTVRRSYLDNNLPPSLTNSVLTAAATHLGVSEDRLRIIEAEPRNWNDFCLEIGRPEENCPQIMIFGWRVMVIGEHQLMVYHTDMINYQIRLNARRHDVGSRCLLWSQTNTPDSL